MGEKQKTEQANRLASIKELFGLGLSGSEIATALNISEATVRNSIKDLGGARNFPLRPNGKDTVFEAILARYADLYFLHSGPPFSERENSLRDILAKWLNEEQILDFIEGVEKAMDILRVPSCPLGKEGYVSLLRNVFNVHWSVQLAEPTPEARREIWCQYLDVIARDKTLLLPTSHLELKHTLAMLWVDTSRSRIMPALPDSAFTWIDEQLATLTPREQDVIKRSYGVCGEPLAQTRAAITQYLGVGVGRVRQIHEKALRKLLHPSRGLKSLIEDASVALARRIELERSNEGLLREINRMREEKLGFQKKLQDLARRGLLEDGDGQFELGVGDIAIEILLKRIDDLEMSVRTTNCLLNHNIYFVGELIMESEVDLLRVHNLGRKSLNEIKEILAELGLRPGLSLSQELKDNIVIGRRG